MAIAPEHPLVDSLTTKENSIDVKKYIEQAKKISEIERMSTNKIKTGQKVGSFALNKFTNEKIPIYIADYVLPNYGTGAVMGVPAHDERDFVFANKYGLDVKRVVSEAGAENQNMSEAYVGNGIMINSKAYDGISNFEAKELLANDIEKKKWGKKTTSFRIRDWLVSRQRYWGTPIPLIECSKCGIQPVAISDLPILLPDDAEFKPSGESPLKACIDFVNTVCPKCFGPAQRETDTMDTFFDSSWYMYRYLNPKYKEAPFDNKLVKSWMPVDQYTGGAEHAVMHLLYARFFTKALRDMGLVDFGEPFLRLFNQGIILGQDHEKMSKSRGNVINPDDVVTGMGADAVRVFLMFIGPWDQGGPWSNVGINGIARWLNRVWTITTEKYELESVTVINQQTTDELAKTLHKTIKKVYEDLDKFKFNTAIAQLMEFSNYLNKTLNTKTVDPLVWNTCIRSFLLMFAPIAPHLAEELWEINGYKYSIHSESFPIWNEELISENVITMIVQVNGKMRDKIEIAIGMEENAVKSLALTSSKIQAHIDGKTINKVIYVPDRLINIVI
jgi:leucyl-tRNA synthetase